MKSRFKIMRTLLSEIRLDLKRPHPFAYERVGFLSAGISAIGEDLLILARNYRPVDDEDYLPDHNVGAMIGPKAINKALQWALEGNGSALFHVHSHGGSGIPGYSGTDLRESVKFVPDFFKVAPKYAHGTVLLSDEAASGQIWFNSKESCSFISGFVEVGSPMMKWRVE